MGFIFFCFVWIGLAFIFAVFFKWLFNRFPNIYDEFKDEDDSILLLFGFFWPMMFTFFIIMGVCKGLSKLLGKVYSKLFK